jgi:hypothetical protein
MKKNIFLDDVSYQDFLNFDEGKMLYYKRFGLLAKHKVPLLKDFPSIVDWPVGKVWELQTMFSKELRLNDIPYILAFVFETIKKGDLERVTYFRIEKWHNVFRLYNHVAEENQLIIQKERTLHYEADGDQEQAGIANINKYGKFATIDTLAGGDPLKYDEIEKIPWRRVFTKLKLDLDKSIYLENLSRIKRNRSK